MTITSNTQLLFPAVSQPNFSPKTSSLIKPQELNAPSFAQVVKTLTPSTPHPPPETGNDSQSAQAIEVRAVLNGYNSLSEPLTDITNAPKNMAPTDPVSPSIRSTKTNELYDWLIEVGTLEPEWAETWAYLYGCEYIDSPLIYIGDWPIERIAATGEIVTQEKLDYFKKVSDLYHGGRVNLYETELAKGTPPLDIIKKIFDYNDTLPAEYRKMNGWS